jgi:hypothetical protein
MLQKEYPLGVKESSSNSLPTIVQEITETIPWSSTNMKAPKLPPLWSSVRDETVKLAP